MELKSIQDLTRDWRSATWKVIEFENPGVKEIGKLFKKTYNLIEECNKEQLVPKEITGVLLEMHDFGWWVSDLPETPIHYLYQEIVSLVCNLNKYFLTRDADIIAIKETINLLYEK